MALILQDNDIQYFGKPRFFKWIAPFTFRAVKMEKALIILSLFISLLANGQSKSFDKMVARNDSICEPELKLRFDPKVGKFGFVDSTETYVIEPQFYCATEFIDCKALTSKKKRCISDVNMEKYGWLYVDKANLVLLAPRIKQRSKWEEEVKTAPKKNSGL